MNPSYEVIVGDVAESAQTIVDVWSHSFESLQGERARQKLAHSYLTNPVGAGPVFLLRDCSTQTVVGVQGMVLRRFFYRGHKLCAGIIADYAVNPAHRSLLPALKLLRSCIVEGRSVAEFLYGLPNRKAEEVTKRAGFEIVHKLGRYAAPLRSAPYLPPKLPAVLKAVLGFTGDVALAAIDRMRAFRLARDVVWTGVSSSRQAGVDAIWAAAVTRDLLVSERSSALLWWRFGLAREAVEVASADALWRIDVACAANDNQPIGYVVWSRRDDVAVIGDFLCAHPAEQTTRLFVAFRCLARRMGIFAISTEYCGNAEVGNALERAGFSLRESSPLYAVRTQAMPPPDHWYFTGLDRDTD